MLQQNSQNDQLTIILQNALNFDQNIRKQAEDQISTFLSQNFGQFLVELSKKISTEQEKKEVRQISATIIKNMINNEKYIEEWFKLSDEIKKAIKDNVLSTLASSDVDIRKAAALTLAGICKIEIPKKQWLNIFDILSSTSQNTDINIQLSSLTTLEYIYEEIQQGDIPNNIVANLLNTYYSLLNQNNINPQLAINTLNSILKFLPFMCDFINDSGSKIKFYDLIEKYIRNDDEKIRKVSLQVFNEISRIYYDSLQDYIEKIFNFSQPIIDKDIDSNKILCIEIWINIGYEEDYRMNVIDKIKKQSHNFLEKYNQALGDLCLKFIVTEDYDNEEYNVSSACFNLIWFMSRCCKYNFLTNMINYIGANINKPIEKIKYSALNVFRAIINTIYKSAFYPIVKDSLGAVSDILIQNNYPSHFKKLCAFIMKSITKNFGEELINDTIYFDKIIELFLSLFKISTKEVLYLLLMGLNNLCKLVEWNENDQTNILSKHMQRLCEPLITLIQKVELYDKENNIISVSFFVLGTLGERSALDVKNQMTNIFKFLSEMFQNTLDKKKFQNDELCYSYQEYLASCLTGFLTTGMADKNSAAILLKNLLNSFEMRKDLYDEGITLMGCISLYTKQDFNAVMELISPYLIKGLRSMDSPSICKTSILCLSDIIRGLESQNKYVNVYLPLVMNILSNNNVERNLKSFCFNIISDLFINCPDEAFKSFQDIMKIIGGAIEATQINFNENSDQDTLNHFINLREHILETLTCIFAAVKEINKTTEFIPYVNVIINYINFIGNDYACSVEIMKSGLFLISDFCVSYKGHIKPFLNLELIKEMITKIENDKIEGKDPTTREGINWAKQVITQIVKNN